MDLGRVEEALSLCRRAVACNLDDAGLICNLALAHCLAGQDQEAERCASEAVRRDPGDTVSSTVLEFIRKVSSGGRKRPKTLSEAFPRE